MAIIIFALVIRKGEIKKMKIIGANLGAKTVEIRLPANTDLISMKKPTRLSKPLSSIKAALKNSSYGPSLDYVIEKKLRQKPDANVVIVISDNTRPVPYSGSQGILWPIIEELYAHGITAERILVLVASRWSLWCSYQFKRSLNSGLYPRNYILLMNFRISKIQ